MYSKLDVMYKRILAPFSCSFIIIDLISEQNGGSRYLSGKNVF